MAYGGVGGGTKIFPSKNHRHWTYHFLFDILSYHLPKKLYKIIYINCQIIKIIKKDDKYQEILPMI
jgi:hypothetical protein